MVGNDGYGAMWWFHLELMAIRSGLSDERQTPRRRVIIPDRPDSPTRRAAWSCQNTETDALAPRGSSYQTDASEKRRIVR